MNACLKKIVDLSKVNNLFPSHITRYIFAITVTLNNAVTIESIAKMMGDPSIKATPIYAKVLDYQISEEMQLLKKTCYRLIKGITITNKTHLISNFMTNEAAKTKLRRPYPTIV